MNWIMPTMCIVAIIGLVVVMVHEVCKADVTEKYELVWYKYTYQGREMYAQIPTSNIFEAKQYLARLHNCKMYEITIKY